MDADTRHLASCCMQIWIARKPPGFAFIDYEDYRDAEDAVRKLDGESKSKCSVRRELKFKVSSEAKSKEPAGCIPVNCIFVFTAYRYCPPNAGFPGLLAPVCGLMVMLPVNCAVTIR